LETMVRLVENILKELWMKNWGFDRTKNK
jgi:hypothetical protein